METRPQPVADEAGLRFDLHLVEQSVLLAIGRAPSADLQAFHAARDPLYEREPGEGREAAFGALHGEWFVRLRLAEPLADLLREQPSIERSVDACLVVPAARRRDEHADLRARRPAAGCGDGAQVRASRGDDRPVLVLRILPATLVDSRALGRLLRRELCYVADMLDPAFRYDPERAVRQTSGALANLLRERHELLWRTSVDGRLAARGELAVGEAERLRQRFETAFPLGARAAAATFRKLFEGPRPSHPALLQLACSPSGEGPGRSVACPLCRMLAPPPQLGDAVLSARAIAAVRRDFPDWSPELGLCPHCADLYELRERSRPTVAPAG